MPPSSPIIFSFFGETAEAAVVTVTEAGIVGEAEQAEMVFLSSIIAVELQNKTR